MAKGTSKSLGPWMRLYVSTLDNPKVARLTEAQAWCWVKFLLYTVECKGIVSLDLTDAAFRLRKPLEKVRDLVQIFISAKLLERCDEGYTPHDWEELQFSSDVSTSRVKEFRERQRNAQRNSDETFHATDQKRPDGVSGNGVATSPEYIEQNTEAERSNTPKPPLASRSVLNGSAELFQAFYTIYPLRKSRRAAEKAFVSALKRTTANAIMEGARRYRDDPQRKPEFTKHPASWLNADGWLDEVAAAAEPQSDRVMKAAIEILERGENGRTN